jgi:hypothetical protein
VAKPCVTFHVHNRETDKNTPRPIKIELAEFTTAQTNLDDTTTDVTLLLEMHRQAFDNQIVFSMHAPLNKGAGEVADALAEEFERFMLEHTPLFMKLGARNLRYLKRFHDDNLSREMSQNTVTRFIAYTLYTERVTATPIDQLQKLETEIRVSLNFEGYSTWVDTSTDSIHFEVNTQGDRVFLVAPPGSASAQSHSTS